MSSPAETSDYDWVEDESVPELTLTLIRCDVGPEDVFAGTGYSVDDTGRGAADTVYSDGDGPEPILVDRIDGWLALLAPNGYLLSLPDIAVPASRVGRLVSVYRSVDHDMSVCVADNGELVRFFDPLLEGADGGDGSPLPEEAGLPFGTDGPVWAAAFALLDRLTGVRITREWIGRERRLVEVSESP